MKGPVSDVCKVRSYIDLYSALFLDILEFNILIAHCIISHMVSK